MQSLTLSAVSVMIDAEPKRVVHTSPFKFEEEEKRIAEEKLF